MKRTPLTRKTPLRAKKPMKAARRPKLTPIQRSAEGQPCTVRVPQVCNGNPETTVLAHLNGGGMACKCPDWQAAYACSACHAFLDGGYVQFGVTRDERDLLHLFAVLETQAKLIDAGLVEVAA